jgi:hypothetical protein
VQSPGGDPQPPPQPRAGQRGGCGERGRGRAEPSPGGGDGRDDERGAEGRAGRVAGDGVHR